MIRISLTSIFVDDQKKALKFYTEKLGFIKKSDLPIGKFKWLTVVSPGGPGDIELLLEPNENPAARTYQEAIFRAGIPATSFGVDDIHSEYKRMKSLGVEFTSEPTETEWGTFAVFKDTCGNLINLHQE